MTGRVRGWFGWVAPLALVACVVEPTGRKGGGDDDDDDTPIAGPSLAVDTFDQASNNNGLVSVDVEVPDGAVSFQVTAEVDRRYYAGVESVFDPSGDRVLYWEDWWDSRQSLTNSVFGFDPTTAINWPVRADDGPLEAGTWRVVFGITDADYYYVDNADTRVTVMTKADDDLDAGEVAVQIVWADGVGDDADVVAAVEAAVERWREVWGAYGLGLDVTYTTSDLPADLSFTPTGSDDVAVIDKPEGALRLIVGEQIRNSASTYGISAGIPGTVQETTHTYVVLSWLTHAGRDATFDAGEISLMGETMAHEVGHYMGLFHPVESNYNSWDALRDTVECSSARSCEDELGNNLMFPYSICDRDGCVAADQMTAEQVAVKQLTVSAL